MVRTLPVVPLSGEAKLKVLIVDDELPIREMLRRFAWEEKGCLLVGEASNGADALSLCARCDPDIVVTDIVMPVMDGMDLIRKARALKPSLQFVILTVYQEFDFARQAVGLGVREYLLKGAFSGDDLAAALGKAKVAVGAAASAARVRPDLREDRGRLVALRNTFAGEATEPPGDLEFPLFLASLQIGWASPPPLAAEDALRAIADETTPVAGEVVPTGGGVFHVIVSGRGPERPIGIWAEALARSLEGRLFGAAVRIASSPRVRSLEEMRAWASSNVSVLKLGFYGCDPAVTASRVISLRGLDRRETMALTADFKEASQRPATLRRYLRDELGTFLAKEYVDPDDARLLFALWTAEMPAKERRRIGTTIAEASTLAEAIDLLCDLASVADSAADRLEVRRALLFVEEHLNEHLSAERIAGHVGLSPNYLAHLFRRARGESLARHIHRVRMEKAAALLVGSNLKVYEVAENVGVPSYRCFVTVFREFHGVTPNQYGRRKGRPR